MYALNIIWGFYQRIFWWLGRKRQERPFANGLAIASAFIGSTFIVPLMFNSLIPAGAFSVIAIVVWGPLLFMYFSQE